MASVTKREWTAPTGEVKTAWVCRYSDLSGKRRMKTFDRKKDADAYRTKVETEVGDGTHIASRDAPTVRRVLELFVEWSRLRCREGRIGKAYLRNIEYACNGVADLIGAIKYTELRAQQVHDAYAAMLASGLSSVTAGERLKIFAEAERHAARRQLIKQRTVADARIDLRGAAPPKVVTATVDQVQAILRTAEIRRPRMRVRTRDMVRCYVHLAAFCGLRFGEIQALLLENVDFEKRIIRVRHSLSSIDGMKGPKSKAGIRDIPLPPHVAELLKDWLARHRVENDEGFVFRSTTDSAISHPDFYNLWLALLKDAGLSAVVPRLHFHALRHFYASLLIDSQMPVSDIAQLMGHSSATITLQVYTHSIHGDRSHQAEAVNRAAQRVLSSPAFTSPSLAGA